MKYPEPQPAEWFWHSKKSTKTHKKPTKTRKKINKQTKDARSYIQKYKNFYAWIPHVTHIYLCNSTTFNANQQTSDIDLLIITQPNRIRIARFYSVLFATILGIKRTIKKGSMKFCLSFYISNDHCNIYHIKRRHADHYLAYRIAHLIPLYTKKWHNKNLILQENPRIHAHIPNYPKELVVNIDSSHDPIYENHRIKNTIEFLHKGIVWNIVERIIKYLRIPIIRYKKTRIKKPEHIITSNTMLKFHHDKRDVIYDAYNITSEKSKDK